MASFTALCGTVVLMNVKLFFTWCYINVCLYCVIVCCLSRAYQKMSASPEAFYSLRMNFARTHSQLCICHYLLGIGDRHQSNYMIDLETGAMVGIDFGHAFGSATQVNEQAIVDSTATGK